MVGQSVDDTYSSSHRVETDYAQQAHRLIDPLRRDRNMDSSLRNFLIRSINKKCFPDTKRVTIWVEPWSDTPRFIKIDSHAKHCVDCGNHAYYVVYEYSITYAFRVCWKHLTDADREALIDEYTIVN